jgi:hypothetical protein
MGMYAGTKTHLHPVQLRVVVGLGQTGEHKVIRVLQEWACAEAGWCEHGRVQGSGRLVGVLCCMGVRRGLRMGVRGGRWRRGRRRWQVFASLVDDAQLHDGRRVDWSTIGCQPASASERPQSMACSTPTHKIKNKKQTRRKWKTRKKNIGRDIPPTPHILACFGCCRMQRSYSREPSMVV